MISSAVSWAKGSPGINLRAGVHNIEWGGHVYLCTGPRQPWGQMWKRLRHYN